MIVSASSERSSSAKFHIPEQPTLKIVDQIITGITLGAIEKSKDVQALDTVDQASSISYLPGSKEGPVKILSTGRMRKPSFVLKANNQIVVFPKRHLCGQRSKNPYPELGGSLKQQRSRTIVNRFPVPALRRVTERYTDQIESNGTEIIADAGDCGCKASVQLMRGSLFKNIQPVGDSISETSSGVTLLESRCTRP